MNAWVEALCRASAFGLAALAVVLIAQFALNKRVPASWRAWIWRIALVQSAFVLLPIAPIRWEILSPPDAATPTAISAPRAKSDEFPSTDNLNLPPLEMPDASLSEDAPVPNVPIENVTPVPIAKVQPAPLDWRALLLALYALGIAFQFAQLMRGKRQLRRVLRNCALNENSVLTARLNVLAARLHLKTAPQLLISEGGSPFLIGITRPRIVLPRALCVAEPSQLDAILAHELAHQKRRDLIWLGATWLLQTLLWFHPISWAARRFHGLETECACDELALQLAPIAPQSYGALLLNSMNNSKFSSPLAAGTCDTLFALKTRLLRLNNAPKTPRKLAKLAFTTTLIISCGALVPLKLVARAGDAPIATTQAAPKSPLAGNAVVQGVITSKQTGKPLADMKLVLLTQKVDSVPEDKSGLKVPPYQETRTDARGYFSFNAMDGQHMLLAGEPTVDLDGTKVSIKADSVTVLKLKDGKKQDLKYKWDEVTKHFWQSSDDIFAGSAILQGIVTSKQTGKPLAGVPMILVASAPKQISADEVSFSANGSKLSLNVKGTLPYAHARSEKTTDVRGYFRFNAVKGDYTLLADGKFMDRASKPTDFSAQGAEMLKVKDGQKRDFTFELGGVPTAAKTPPVNVKELASASGQVLDENKRPLAGATVHLHGSLNSESPMGVDTKSDTNGRFRFENLQPGTKITLTSALKGYGIYPQKAYIVERDKNAGFVIEMHRVTTLHGIVIDENGRPASDFVVFASGADMSTVTQKSGRFFLPKVLSGSVNVDVWHKPDGELWGPFKAQGGDQNVKIRLTKSTSNARSPLARFYKPLTPKTMSNKTRALIGKTAPEIQALHWANGKATPLSSLRGNIVLLAFEIFDSDEKSVLNDLARSLIGRVQIVGVEANVPQSKIPYSRLDKIAAQFSFPIALDTPRADSKKFELGGQTFSAYGLGGRAYAIIGRDGKIIYAGDELKSAIKFASR